MNGRVGRHQRTSRFFLADSQQRAVNIGFAHRKIDSFMVAGLEALPGFPPGLMAILATRNLRRGLALGLPSGQGMAKFFGIPPMTAAQLTSGLPANEVAILNLNGRVLLKKDPALVLCSSGVGGPW
jgi:hypothetical protein